MSDRRNRVLVFNRYCRNRGLGVCWIGDQPLKAKINRIKPGEQPMIAIRLPKDQWGEAWRAMIEVGPVRLVAKDPIYEVLAAHLDLLNARGFSYEVVIPQQRNDG